MCHMDIACRFLHDLPRDSERPRGQSTREDHRHFSPSPLPFLFSLTSLFMRGTQGAFLRTRASPVPRSDPNEVLLRREGAGRTPEDDDDDEVVHARRWRSAKLGRGEEVMSGDILELGLRESRELSASQLHLLMHPTQEEEDERLR